MNLQLLKTKSQGRKEKKIMYRYLFVLEAVFPWTELSVKEN